VRADGAQLAKPIVIFKAKNGTKLRKEQAQYDDRVHVFYQKSAWADRKVLLQAVDLLPFNAGDLLMLDGLRSHRGEFVEKLRQRGVTCWFGPAHLTDVWQPIDAGTPLPT